MAEINYDDTVKLSRIVLEKVPFNSRQYISDRFIAEAPCISNHMELEVGGAVNGFYLDIRSFMLGKKRFAGSHVVDFKFPDGPWEYAKFLYAPEWVKKRWPVKFRVMHKEVENVELRCCPHLNMKFPKEDKIHFEWLSSDHD